MIVRAKDRFNKPLDSGYRDMLLNLTLNGSKHVGELQLHLRDIIDIKEAAHRTYALMRAVGWEVSGGVGCAVPPLPPPDPRPTQPQDDSVETPDEGDEEATGASADDAEVGGGIGGALVLLGTDTVRLGVATVQMVKRSVEQFRVDEHLTLARESWTSLKQCFTAWSNPAAAEAHTGPQLDEAPANPIRVAAEAETGTEETKGESEEAKGGDVEEAKGGDVEEAKGEAEAGMDVEQGGQVEMESMATAV